jgi:hypothetical protein
LRLFGKFMPILKGWCRFHSTHKVGPWTLLTSNQSNALLAVLKTGGNGGWLTVVARWHMRYSLRRISRWRHDRASELRANPFALRVSLCLAAVVHRVLCIVWYHRAPIVTHTERSHAFNSLIVTRLHHAGPHPFDHPSRQRRYGSRRYDTRTHLGADNPC